MKFKKITLLLFFSLILFSCKNDKPEENNTIDPLTLTVNNFILETMSTFYLWTDQLPIVDIRYEKDSKAYFEKLRVKEDPYSFISDDAEGLINSLNGIEKTYGYSLTLTWTNASKTSIYAIVDYVYSSSPAAKAGIMRGDIIVSMNGNKIVQSNVNDLMSSNSINLEVGKYDNGAVVDVRKVALARVQMELNPMPASWIKEIESKKVGYLLFSEYTQNFNDEVNAKFKEFKDAGVTEFILDLRYNSGGDNLSIINLCSNLAPAENVRKKDIIYKEYYNPLLTIYYEDRNRDPNTYFDDENLEFNLGITNLYVLTSSNTASASEVTIMGLKSYMNVVCIGDKTVGKYTSMAIIQPYISEDKLDETIKNWVILPVISHNANKEGNSAKGGIPAKYSIEFTLPFLSFNDVNEPHIAKALELITGVKKRSAKITSNEKFEVIKTIKSPYDDFKQNIFNY